MPTLHVTNGDSAAGGIAASGLAASGLAASGLAGPVLPWRDVLHDGPVPPDGNVAAFRLVRSRFLASRGWATAEAVQGDMAERDARLEATGAGDDVILWFEPDLYDQLQLAQILARFAARESAARPSLTIVAADTYLGPLDPPAFPPLFSARRSLRDSDLAAGARAWHAFTADSPDALVALARSPQPAPRARSYEADPEARLPYLNGALSRMLEEYPARSGGLSRSEMQLCEVLSAGERPLGEAYPAAHHAQERWSWLGDLSFAWYLERLSRCPRPLVELSDGSPVALSPGSDQGEFWKQAARLTAFGHDVLNGKGDAIVANGIDRWIGSVHLTEERHWRWDASAQRLIATP